VITAWAAIQRWIAPLRRPGVIGVGILGGIYAACALLKGQALPGARWWIGAEPLNVLLVVTGGVTIVTGSLVIWGYSRLLKTDEVDNDLLDACKGAWLFVVREMHIPHEEMEKLGVHVWSVAGFKGAKYLVRRATFTIRTRRATRVLWRKGVGAIGIAWATNQAVIADVEALESIASSEVEFAMLPRDVRYGLTWQEFHKARHYRAIVAIPLETRRDHVAGCLSFDIQLDGYADRLDTLARRHEISTIRDICERALG
jgi:hypothetical protein